MCARKEALPTIDIKGKAYVTVDTRVEEFRNRYPLGSIVTEIVADDGDRCVVKASAIVDGVTVATGHAFEVKSASYINKTSYLENCETSAVGRALGFLGIGLNGSIASADEVSAAIGQQDLGAAKKRLWAAINAYAKANGRKPEDVLQGAMKRPEWAETEEAYSAIAADFEGAL